MTSRIKALLWSLAGVYEVIRTYQAFRSSSPDLSWFTPYLRALAAGIALFAAFATYRDGRTPWFNGAPNRSPLTPGERITFKALGLPNIMIGVAMVSLGVWLGWKQWIKVAQWPRTNAVLVTKDISTVGARLIFRYDVGGRQFTGTGFRWGRASALESALRRYEPGTIQTISYDPEDPADVETNLSFGWDLFLGGVFGSRIWHSVDPLRRHGLSVVF